MTATELRECLDALCWSQRHLGDVLTADERLIRKWAAGRVAIPENVAVWLRTLAAVHRAHPHPDGWEIRLKDLG